MQENQLDGRVPPYLLYDGAYNDFHTSRLDFRNGRGGERSGRDSSIRPLNLN